MLNGRPRSDGAEREIPSPEVSEEPVPPHAFWIVLVLGQTLTRNSFMGPKPESFDQFWRCVQCGCSVKHFLGICWKCGAARPGGEVARQESLEREREILSEPWEDVLKNWPREVLERCKRDTKRGLRRIDLAGSIVLSTADHVEAARVVRRLGTLHASNEEISNSLATYLSDYYGEGYHGELHHTGYSELVLFMLMYKAHQLGANAVINVTLMHGYPLKVSGEAVVVELL